MAGSKPLIVSAGWRPLATAFIVLCWVSSSYCQAPPVAKPKHEDAINPSKEKQVQNRNIMKAVNTLLRREHLSRKSVDDEKSQRALELFIKMLDPVKLYFTAADIAEFEKSANDLDDMVVAGNLDFAQKVYARYLDRFDERVAMVDQLLNMDHDFTVDEAYVADPKKLTFAETKEEAFDRWRKRIKYDLLLLKLEKVEGEKAKERLNKRYHSLAKRLRKENNDKVLELFLTAVTTSFDPHTTYMSPATLESFSMQLRLNLEGIGAALKMNDGLTEVSKIVPGGAAEKQGELKENDQIASVGQGESGEMVDVVDMPIDEVVQMIRGKAGTVVRLGVVSAGATEAKIVKITRARIELTDSEARSEVFDVGKNPAGQPYRVGVIDLPSFYMDMDAAKRGDPNFKSTTRDMRIILNRFTKDRIDAVVLDLRKNGGGSLTEAINLTGLFIDKGPVVQVKNAEEQVDQYADNDTGMAWKGPLVVLTSKFSASASEIFAGAIQDYQRGIIVGDSTTHGKGTVQTLIDLGEQMFRPGMKQANMGALKVTMQKFYRANGDSTQKVGVPADVTLPSLTDNWDGIAEADLEFALDFDRVPEATHERYNLVSRQTVDTLRKRSVERQKSSPDFEKQRKDIEMYISQKAVKSVELNEEKFMAQRQSLDAEKEEEKQFAEEHQKDKDKIFDRNFYGEEVLQLTADYLDILGTTPLAKAR